MSIDDWSTDSLPSLDVRAITNQKTKGIMNLVFLNILYDLFQYLY